MKRALVRYGVPALVLEGALLGLISLSRPFQSFAVFLLLVIAAFAAFMAAAVLAWRDERAGRAATMLIFGAAAVFRLTLLPFEPSDDMHRYLFEGRMQLAGFNPFALAPDAPELAHLRDAVIYPRVNGKEHATIYPPLAQLLFASTAAVSCTFPAFKIVFIGFDLACGIFLLLLLGRRGIPPIRVLLYLWCPQVLFSVAGRGHVDAVQTCGMVAALWLFTRDRTRSSALVLGLAIMAKTVAVILLPVFVIHARRRRDLWPVLVPFLLYLPYAGSGYGLVKSLFMFGFSWTTNASLYTVLSFGQTSINPAHAAAAIAFLVVLLRARTVEHAAFGAWAVFLVFTPTFHPWYFVGLAPFLALRWRPAWLLLSCTLFFYYSFIMTGAWRPIEWMPLVEYAPFYALLGWAWVRGRRRDPGTQGPRDTGRAGRRIKGNKGMRE